MDKIVILLNGASSSGKSTIARSLRRLLKEKVAMELGVVSIDDHLEMTCEEPIYEDDVYDIMPQLCAAAQNALKTRNGVIIDHVITSERIYQKLLHALEKYEIYKVHVTCSPEALHAREQKRRNRCIGSAAASNDYLFPKDGYDICVDTSQTTGEQCAQYIAAQLFPDVAFQ